MSEHRPWGSWALALQFATHFSPLPDSSGLCIDALLLASPKKIDRASSHLHFSVKQMLSLIFQAG